MSNQDLRIQWSLVGPGINPVAESSAEAESPVATEAAPVPTTLAATEAA